MIMNRLSVLTNQFTKRALLQRVTCRSNTQSAQIKNKKSDDDNDDDDEMSKPVQYSTSPAAQWRAKFSQQGGNFEHVPKYQPHIVWVSTLTFLVYFVWMREPNDIDELLDRELGDHFPGLNEADIRRKLPPEVITKRVS